MAAAAATTKIEASKNDARLSSIPQHMRIKVLKVDDSVIVIVKPGNLRSVPGHANSPPSKTRKRSHDETQPHRRRTAQEAWTEAIKMFSTEKTSFPESIAESIPVDVERFVSGGLSGLSKFRDLASVPRKWIVFLKYVRRNKQRVWKEPCPEDQLESVAMKMYKRIEAKQRPLLNLPEPTKHEESALGQLILMGYADDDDSSTSQRRIFVVHRLDCQTSGVMVFARNQEAASALSKVWRERDRVKKIYIARVHRWPPYHEEGKREGRIDLPLSPSHERLKWKVDENKGKRSTTLWRVMEEAPRISCEESAGGSACDPRNEGPVNGDGPLLLELTPVTGRTHQLRIHCSHIGSGIEGDNLYGPSSDASGIPDVLEGTLCLHAQQLTFPHPKTGEPCRFCSQMPASWDD